MSEPSHDPNFRTIDLSAEIKKIWGPHWNEPEISYEFGDRIFKLRTGDAYEPDQGNDRDLLNQVLLDGNTVANYQPGIGLTGTTNASVWANQIGIAGSLVQATESAQPSIQADGSLLFDGVSDRLKTATFTLNQPTMIYMVVKQVTWTSLDRIFDGNAVNSGAVYQVTGSPEINIFAGSNVAGQTSLALNTYGVLTVCFNGASSFSKIDSNAAVSGNAGSSNMSGFSLASEGGGSNPGNIQVQEIIIRNVVDSAATQANIQLLLKQLHGTP